MTKAIRNIIKHIIMCVLLFGLILTFGILLSFNDNKYAVEIAEYEDSWEVLNCQRDGQYDGWSIMYVGNGLNVIGQPISKANIINAPRLKKDIVYTNCLVYKPIIILGFRFSYPIRMKYAVNIGEPNVVRLGNTTLIDYYNKDNMFRNQWNTAMTMGIDVFHELELSSGFDNKINLFKVLYYFYFIILGIITFIILDHLYKIIKEYILLSRMDDIEKEKYYISKNKNHKSKEWE